MEERGGEGRGGEGRNEQNKRGWEGREGITRYFICD